MNKRVSCSLLLISSLTACTPHYVQPTVGATAKIRFKNIDESSGVWVHTFKGPGCDSPQAIGIIGSDAWAQASHPTHLPIGMLGSASVPDAHIIERTVPADRPFTVLFTEFGRADSATFKTCKLPVTFTPTNGWQYEVEFKNTPGKCDASVFALSSAQTGAIHRQPVSDTAKGDNACKPFKF